MRCLWLLTGLWLLGSGVFAQATLNGRVTDEKGAPLIGAAVFISETEQGASTGMDGSYRIESIAPGRYQLEVSYLGYAPFQKSFQVRTGEKEVKLDIQLLQNALQIAPLTVKATRAGAATPMTYSTIDEEAIEKLNLGQDVPFVLRWTPSAVVTSDAGAGVGYTGIRIRGTDPTRINVTINGIPLNDAESQGVFWVNLPDLASSTSDIQVQRGVGTSTNGAGAFGATINLNTSKLRAEPYATVNTSYGSFNTRKANLQLGTGLINNRFAFDGRLSRIQSDGYIDRATADLSSYYLSGAYFGNRSSLRLNVFSGHEITYQAWYGVPADNLDDRELRTFNPAGTEKEGEPHDDEVDNYRQTHYQLLFDHQFSRKLALNLSLHYTQGEGYFEQYKAGESLADYGLPSVVVGSNLITETDLIRRLWLDNDFYGGIYALNYQTDDNRLDFTLGGGYNIYEGGHFGEITWAEFASTSEKDDRYYENDARKTDFNVYGRLNYELFSDFNAYLDLQFRRVGYEFLGFNREGENVEQEISLNFFNPKFGLYYQLDRASNLYASFAVANREPNRNDYVDSTIDSRPEPETLYNTEAGYRFQGEQAALQANVYYMLYRDQLVLNGEVNDVGAYTRINVENSYRIGLELAGGWQLLPALRLDGNLTLSRNRVEGFTEFVDVYDENFVWLGQEPVVYEDTELSFSPAVIAGGGPTLELFPKNDQHGLSLNWQTKYVSEQYIDNTSDASNVIDAYTFTDLRLRYELTPSWGKQLAITFLVQNAFDALYETNAWSYRYVFDGNTTLDQGYFPQAGRNYLLGLTIGL